MADGTDTVLTERSCRTRSSRNAKSTSSVTSLDVSSIYSNEQNTQAEDRKVKKKN